MGKAQARIPRSIITQPTNFGPTLSSPSNERSVLVIGFSVTAQNPGYISVLGGLIPKNIHLGSIGLGGLHPGDIALLASAEENWGLSDAVVFEINTSSYRKQGYSVKTHLEILTAITSSPFLRNSKIGFLDLPRRGVGLDKFTLATKIFCWHRGFWYARVRNSARYYTDEVHTSSSGAERYGQVAARLIERMMSGRIQQNRRQVAPPVQIFNSRPRATPGQRYQFSRAGVVEEYIVAKAGETTRYRFSNESLIRIVALEIIFGPDSGAIQLISDQARPLSISGVDEHSYYNRKVILHLDILVKTDFKILQLDQIGPVTLRKGEFSPGSRIGRFGRVFWVESNSKFL